MLGPASSKSELLKQSSRTVSIQFTVEARAYPLTWNSSPTPATLGASVMVQPLSSVF